MAFFCFIYLLVGLGTCVCLGFGDQPVFGSGHLRVVTQSDVRLSVASPMVTERCFGIRGTAYAIGPLLLAHSDFLTFDDNFILYRFLQVFQRLTQVITFVLGVILVSTLLKRCHKSWAARAVFFRRSLRSAEVMRAKCSFGRPNKFSQFRHILDGRFHIIPMFLREDPHARSLLALAGLHWTAWHMMCFC